MIEVQIIATGPVGPVGPQGPEGPGPATDEQVQNAVDNLIAEDPSSVQDAVDDYLEDHPTVKGTFSNAAKHALIALLEKVAYIDQDGQDYLDTLETELFTLEVDSVDAVFTQGANTIYDTDPLDRLKQYLVVTATYVDETTEVLSPSVYTLSGTLTVGTSTITVTYGGKTDTFDVIVKERTNLATTPISWNSASGSLVVISGSNVKINGNGSGYPNAVLTNLLYQLSEATNKQVHIIGDVVVSGLTSGSYRVLSELFPNQTPSTMGDRVTNSGGAFTPNVMFDTNGSYHLDSVFVPGTESEWEGLSGYIGIILFGNSPNSGASASFSNMVIYWEDV